ncbi:hypothetical protein PoB_000193100 [Plakobranchus ocellatus]|uniref:Uncharacterized protein n=1 Tax=Plakobranchus ocellatus TaxID=259542 RepID=A0AAV3X696_9GAST|nr:hypothetical protein PoB_000193100 [Plakobranchus ocellatus]
MTRSQLKVSYIKLYLMARASGRRDHLAGQTPFLSIATESSDVPGGFKQKGRYNKVISESRDIEGGSTQGSGSIITRASIAI